MTNAKNHAAPELPEDPSSTLREGTPEYRRLFALHYTRRYAPERLLERIAKQMGHPIGEMLSLNEQDKESAALLSLISHYDLGITRQYMLSAKAQRLSGLRQAVATQHFKNAMGRFDATDTSERPQDFSGRAEYREGSEGSED
jgi:hypothetical protein